MWELGCVTSGQKLKKEESGSKNNDASAASMLMNAKQEMNDYFDASFYFGALLLFLAAPPS